MRILWFMHDVTVGVATPPPPAEPEGPPPLMQYDKSVADRNSIFLLTCLPQNFNMHISMQDSQILLKYALGVFS